MKIELIQNKVYFNNGSEKKEIHPFWLRERVNDEQFLDKGTQQRLFDPTFLNSDISINKVNINEKYLETEDIQRFHGWWGNKLETRFEMENNFEYSNTANVWQVSNPPILSMVPIKAALDIIKDAGGIQALRRKSISMSKYFDYLLVLNCF